MQEFLAGSTFEMTLKIRDKTTKQPIDLGVFSSISVKLRQKSNSSLIDTLTVTPVPESAGTAIIQSSGPTDDWPPGILAWNIRLEKAGKVYHTQVIEFSCKIPPTRP